jgi:hypothetical protein
MGVHVIGSYAILVVGQAWKRVYLCVNPYCRLSKVLILPVTIIPHCGLVRERDRLIQTATGCSNFSTLIVFLMVDKNV